MRGGGIGSLHRVGTLVHASAPEHEPVETDVRKFLFHCLHDVDGRSGAVVEDAAEGGGVDSEKIGKHLLGHVLALHERLDSVFHNDGWGRPLFFGFF